jgi:hypothetical protein
VNGYPDFGAFTAVDQSTYDTFETVFGVELFTNGVNPLGIDALQGFIGKSSVIFTGCPGSSISICIKLICSSIQEICNKLYYGTSNIQAQSLDIWCGDGWATTTDDQGDYYTLADGSIGKVKI